MNTNSIDARVYPIDEPKGSTIAFASVAIGDLAAIRGIRIIESEEKGTFVSMPQSQDNKGQYRDIAFPLTAELRNEINAAVLDEYNREAALAPNQRGYEKTEKGAADVRSADDVKLNVKVFPIAEPKGDTLAFASVGMDDSVAIRGIRVVNSDKGQFVSMPQSKDKDGKFHDIAFPLSGDLRKAISKSVLAEFKQQISDIKKGIGARIAEGKEQSARYAASAPTMAAAKKAPGLGD
jgi:DNA-binding cell septation regulator SpoVG